MKETIGLSQPRRDGDDIYWIEMRPSERGRQVIVRRSRDGRCLDINPPEFNARTRVHEYGGGDYVVHESVVYFSNYRDQQIYKTSDDASPELLTRECSDDRVRYADAIVDAKHNRLICVREDHRKPNQQPENSLIAIALTDGAEVVLVRGNDFYSSPRVSADGNRLAWLTWNRGGASDMAHCLRSEAPGDQASPAASLATSVTRGSGTGPRRPRARSRSSGRCCFRDGAAGASGRNDHQVRSGARYRLQFG